jgi:hypothetical protein
MAIILPSGFNITNNEPVDARFSLADQTARYGLSPANIYEGLVVYQRDNNTLWILVDTAEVSNANGWQQVTSSELSDTITDRLDSLEEATGSYSTTGSNTFNGEQNIIGSVTSSKVLTDSIVFDTTAGISVGVGELAWNNTDGTLDLGMKGGNVVQQIGQEILYEVRNDSGNQIENGTAVYSSGVTVGSGRITAAPFTADGNVREVRFLGLATEDINNGVNGLVTYFGYVRGLDTRGTAETAISVGDEDWSVGDILYAHPTVPGKLTNIPPKHKIYVAIIITRHQSVGVLFVRPTSYGHMDDIHDVLINTGSLSTGDLLVYYDSQTQNWINTRTLSGSYQIDNGDLTIDGNLSASSYSGVISQSAQIDVTQTTNYDQVVHISGSQTIVGEKTFTGTQTFSNIVVNGTGSFAFIQSTTGSSTSIGEAFIILNENTPSSNFAGIKVVDSGSSFTTASFVYDGLNNNWVFEHEGSVNSGSSLAIFGPLSQGGLGTEVGLTENRIPKAVTDHGHHIGDSNISDNGTLITLNSNTQVNGDVLVTGTVDGIDLQNFSSSVDGRLDSLEGDVHEDPLTFVDTTTIDFTRSGDNIFADVIGGVVSGSTQISYPDLSNIPSGIVSGSSQVTSLLPTGVVSGSVQVSYPDLSNIPSGIVSGSTQITKTLQEVTTAGNTTSTSISITNSTASTSKTTGALVVTGGIGTSGDVFAGGDVVAYASSDKRLKDNILPIQNSLQKINQIGGYSFEWNEEKQHIYKGKDYGVIAQEIEEILPELVENRENGYKAVKYDKLVSLLIEGIKELSKEVSELKEKIGK